MCDQEGDSNGDRCLSQSSSVSSTMDENTQKLFSFNGNEDGFIDSRDLRAVCEKLGMEDVDDIMGKLGCDSNGKMSYEEFSRCRSKILGELNTLSPDEHPSSDLSLALEGKQSDASGKDSWELDSGARDLSPEPQVKYKVSNSSKSANFLELANTLHLAALASLKNEIADLNTRLEEVTGERNALQQALDQSSVEREQLISDYEERLQIQAVRSEHRITELQSVIAELNKKLNQSSVIETIEEVEEEQELSPTASEHGSLTDSSEEEDDNNCNAEQMKEIDLDDELSRVVGELELAVAERKKLTENDPEKLKADLELDEIDQRIALETDRACRDIEQNQTMYEELEEKCNSLREQCHELEKRKASLEKQIQHASVLEYIKRKNSSGEDSSPSTKERESLKAKLRKVEQELNQSKSVNLAIREERERLRRKVRELHEALRSRTSEPPTPEDGMEEGLVPPKSPQMPRIHVGSDPSPWLRRPNQEGGYRPPFPTGWSSNVSTRGCDSVSGSSQRRPSNTSDRSFVQQRHLSPQSCPSVSSQSPQMQHRNPSFSGTSDLGSSLSSATEFVPARLGDDVQSPDGSFIDHLQHFVEYASSKFSDKLLCALQKCKSIKELFQVFYLHSSELSDHRAREHELDMERMSGKVDHLQSQNNVLSLSLLENKANSERMSILLGKYESNNTAMSLALQSCDQALEAYDVLVQLLEADYDVLYANFQASGLGDFGLHSPRSYQQAYADQEDPDEDDDAAFLKNAHRIRQMAESNARVLLQKIERGCDPQGAQPWEDLSSHSRTSATSSNSSNEVEFTKEEECRLKNYIQHLRADRSTFGETVLELESISEILEPVDPVEVDPVLSQKMDLENAVLLQELMALKEERAELKAKYYLLDKEKKAIEQRLNTREAQEQAYVVHIEHLKSEVKEQARRRKRLEREGGRINRTSSQDEESSGSFTLLEDDAEKRKLRSRVQELVEALENLSKNSERGHQLTVEYVADLKRANGALVSAYEKAKRKHNNRIKKLETQMMTLVERHDTQVRTLKERIRLVEEELAAAATQNETAL